MFINAQPRVVSGFRSLTPQHRIRRRTQGLFEMSANNLNACQTSAVSAAPTNEGWDLWGMDISSQENYSVRSTLGGIEDLENLGLMLPVSGTDGGRRI